MNYGNIIVSLFMAMVVSSMSLVYLSVKDSIMLGIVIGLMVYVCLM